MILQPKVKYLHKILDDELRKCLCNVPFQPSNHLTLKHRETHGCVVSTVATDALVLKHQAISILSTD